MSGIPTVSVRKLWKPREWTPVRGAVDPVGQPYWNGLVFGTVFWGAEYFVATDIVTKVRGTYGSSVLTYRSSYGLASRFAANSTDTTTTRRISWTLPFIPAPFSIAALVQLGAGTSAATYGGIVTRGGVFENNTNFNLSYYDRSTGDRWLALHSRDGAGVTSGANGGRQVPTNVPVMVGASWDTNYLARYIGGSPDDFSTNSPNGADGGQSLRIGGPNTYTSNDRNLWGSVMAVYIWNRLLTDSEHALLASDPYCVVRPAQERIVIPADNSLALSPPRLAGIIGR